MKNTEKKIIGKAFVGIDVHEISWKVCFSVDYGFKKQFSCDPETKVLVKTLTNLLPNFSFDCAYESGLSCETWNLYLLLQRRGSKKESVV